MTLASRNTLLLTGILFSLLVLAVCVAIVVIVAISGYSPPQSDFAIGERWLVFRWTAAPISVAWVMAGTAVSGLAASVGAYFLRRFFRKTSAPEVFFFTLFTITLCFESLRSVELYFLFLNLPTLYGIIVTRVVYFGYFLGAFCLLGSSLYTAGVQYQKYGNALGIAALVSFALAYVVPIDSLSPFPSLLFRIGNETTTQTIALVIGMLTLLSYAMSVVTGGTEDRLPIALAVLMVILGRELLFYLSNPVVVTAGAILLIGGMVLYGVRNYKLYLWM